MTRTARKHLLIVDPSTKQPFVLQEQTTGRRIIAVFSTQDRLMRFAADVLPASSFVIGQIYDTAGFLVGATPEHQVLLDPKMSDTVISGTELIYEFEDDVVPN